MYLKQNNSLYYDIGIALENIPNDLLSMSENSNNHQEFDKADTLEEDENPLDLPRFSSQGTMFVPTMTTAEEISIAPGEGKEPTSLLNDKYCENFAFPCLFPKGKYGYKVERKIKLSPLKYSLRKTASYHLTSWCGNFVEMHSFRIFSFVLPETIQKLCLSAKFPHQEVR